MLRTSTSYFDKTPTGRLISRFSNDLSILDSTIGYTLIDTIEGPILSIILLINVFQIVPFFIIPGVLCILLQLLWFIYCKRTIIQTKQLDLRTKSPVFSQFGELVAGAIQVRIYGQTDNTSNKMSRIVNRSAQANHSFWFASRVFGVWTSFVSNLVVAAGIFLGISWVDNAGIYGISIVFVMQVSDYMQWFLRQIINMESIMVSVER